MTKHFSFFGPRRGGRFNRVVGSALDFLARLNWPGQFSWAPLGRLNYSFGSGKLPGRKTSWVVRIGLKMGKLPIGSISLAKLSPMRTGLKLYKVYLFLPIMCVYYYHKRVYDHWLTMFCQLMYFYMFTNVGPLIEMMQLMWTGYIESSLRNFLQYSDTFYCRQSVA